MLWQTGLARLTTAIGCALFALPIAAQTPRAPYKVGTWAAAESARPAYFGILGEVSRPGVYSTTAQNITLQDLVRQAGGATAQASPTVRIVRQARTAHSLFFLPSGRDALQPNDVVVFDGLSPSRVVIAPNVVWLCFLGVIDRPVVVPIRPEIAQLSRVAGELLGQSNELASTVKVALPSRTPPLSGADALLPNGTVLVFDRGLLVERNLPPFPEPLPFDNSPAAARPTTDRAAALNDQLAPPPPASGNNGWSTSLTAQTRDRVTATPVPFPSVNDEPATANPASLPAPGSRFHIPPREPAPRTESAAIEFPPVDPRVAADQSVEIFPAPTPPDHQLPAAASSQNAVLWWQMLGISGTVACLIGIAIATRKYLDQPPRLAIVEQEVESRESSVETQTIADSQKLPANAERRAPNAQPDDLTELLSGRLVIANEPVQFPKQFPLQRQRDRASASYRLDEGQRQAPAPHHQPSAQPQPREIAIDRAAAGIPRPHFAASPRQPSATPSADTGRPRTLVVAGTAFERALSQLQGGSQS